MRFSLLVLVGLLVQLSAQANPTPLPVHTPPINMHPPGTFEPAPNIKQVVCKGFNNIVLAGSTFAAYSAEVRKEQMAGGYLEADHAGLYFECVDGNTQTPLFVDPSDAPLYAAMSALLANYSTQPVANAGVRASYFRYDLNSTVACNAGKPCYRVVMVYGYNTGG